MSAITISVDSELAEKYRAAPQRTRDWFEYQTRLRMKEMLYGRKQSLLEIMDELSSQAKANGLTPEILEEILNEKSPC